MVLAQLNNALQDDILNYVKFMGSTSTVSLILEDILSISKILAKGL